MLSCISDIDLWTDRFPVMRYLASHPPERRRFFSRRRCRRETVARRSKLGVMMEGELSMTAHVNKMVGHCFYSLRKKKSVRRSLFADATVTLVTSLICSRIDCCNTIFAGLPNSTIDRLHSMLHAAVRIIMVVHITLTWSDKLH